MQTWKSLNKSMKDTSTSFLPLWIFEGKKPLNKQLPFKYTKNLIPGG